MFSSFFSATDPTAQNLHPVTNGVAPADLFGELGPDDLNWVCAGGFVTETHIWYYRLDDGSFLMCQIIHSAVGLWYPTVQFTFRLYNPATKENTWRSVNVGGFVAPAPGSNDKKTCKSDKFTVLYKPATDITEETYSITSNPADDVQISLDASRVASVPGFKVGKGPKGGYTYFGADVANPDGHVFHKFWPMTTCKGTIVIKGKAISANGSGMFVHATQGMRPNLVATRWNFSHFEGDEQKTSATMMEFTTTPSYGKKGEGSGGVVVNVGCVVKDGKLTVVTGETIWPGELADDGALVQSRAKHHDTKKDKDTGYNAPTRLSYHWKGPSLLGDAAGTLTASVDLSVGDPQAYSGLIEKIDVLAEIPGPLKAVINYAAGVKPYIYAWLNPATLNINLPDGKEEQVKGIVFNEATFIS